MFEFIDKKVFRFTVTPSFPACVISKFKKRGNNETININNHSIINDMEHHNKYTKKLCLRSSTLQSKEDVC